MSYFINGKETPLERSSLNPKIRKGRRTIDFTNNSFRDSHSGSSLDISAFVDECSSSLSQISEIDKFSTLYIPKMKNVLISCFGASIGHVNDSLLTNTSFRVMIDIKKHDSVFINHDFLVDVSIKLMGKNSDGKHHIELFGIQLFYDDDKDIYTSNLHRKTIKTEFEIDDIFLSFDFYVTYDKMKNEFGVVINDQSINGSYSTTQYSHVSNSVVNMSKRKDLKTGVVYKSNNGGISLSLPDPWIGQDITLKKYKNAEYSDDTIITIDNVFQIHDISGFDEFSLESSDTDFQYDAEFVHEDGSQNISVDISFFNILKHRIYHNICFLKPDGNEVCIKNITNKKVVIQSLSYE